MSPVLLDDRYELGPELGRGGMGVVHRAKDRLLDREVAVKLLTPQALDPAAHKRFLREARAAARLAHPHIVTVYDAGEQDRSLYLVMELVPGSTLRGLGRLPPREVVAVGRQLALALAHAHSRGIIHRDLKPENVLVAETSPPRVKLMDFGLARVQGSSRLTRKGAVAGTFTYLAPEQILGHESDHRGDLYALGVLLYELAAGRPPFTGGSPQAVLAQHVQAAPASPRTHAPAIPEGLESLILKLLAKDPADRPPTAEAVAAALETLAGGTPSSEPATPARGVPSDLLDLPDLIGREADLDALIARIDDDARLVTLSGPGGIGKTRLAMHLAVELAARIPRVAFVALAGLEDPALVESVVAKRLGIEPSSDVAASLKEALATRTLLVLDNFEHLIPASKWLAALIADCPALQVIVTSRRPLRLSAEREYPVPPLALPEAPEASSPIGGGEGERARKLGESPAVALFVRRARAVQPSFVLTDQNADAVAEVCARLDGLPLAIELAAARARLLPPAALRDHLRAEGGPALRLLAGGAQDLPDRQRTLHAAIEWSHAMLAEPERSLFRRLSVFRGSASLAAIQAVCCGDGVDPSAALDAIASLVDQSLVRRREAIEDEARFTMLETLRDFARERLEAAGEREDVARRHAEWFLAAAETAAPRLRVGDEALLTRLERDQDNYRAALEWTVVAGDAQARVRLALALRWFWRMRGGAEEGRRWLDSVIEAKGLPDALRAQALLASAVLVQSLGHLDQAADRYRKGLEIARAIGEGRVVTSCLGNLAIIALERGDYAGAQTLLEESLAILRTRDDPNALGVCLINLSVVAMYFGDNARNEALGTEALAILRHAGNEWAAAAAVDNAGLSALYRGDLERAEAGLEESLAMWRKLGDRRGVGRALIYVGRCAVARGDGGRAIERLCDSLRLLGPMRERVLLADVFEVLASACLVVGDAPRAARLVGAADAIRDRTGAVVTPPDRPSHDALMQALDAALDPSELLRGRAEGRALGLDEAVALGLSAAASSSEDG